MHPGARQDIATAFSAHSSVCLARTEHRRRLPSLWGCCTRPGSARALTPLCQPSKNMSDGSWNVMARDNLTHTSLTGEYSSFIPCWLALLYSCLSRSEILECWRLYRIASHEKYPSARCQRQKECDQLMSEFTPWRLALSSFECRTGRHWWQHCKYPAQLITHNILYLIWSIKIKNCKG